jgi:hypothetical protein
MTPESVVSKKASVHLDSRVATRNPGSFCQHWSEAAPVNLCETNRSLI